MSRHGQGRPDRAARLFGATPSSFRALGTVIIAPDDPAQFDREVAALHARLGDAAFAAAYTAGRAMSPEQTIAYALADAKEGAWLE